MNSKRTIWGRRSLRRYFVDDFFDTQMPKFKPQSHLLDLGGHKNSTRGHFNIQNYDVEVLYVNLSTEKGADLISNATQVGLADSQFDGVICAELLEHVSNPNLVLKEAYRLLKPGGVLLITVPFLFHIHADPYDYGRYTDQYWLENLESVGFRKQIIERQGLYYSVMASHREWYLKQIRPPRPFGRPTHWFLTQLIANSLKSFALWRESRPWNREDPFLNRFTTGFGIVAYKNE